MNAARSLATCVSVASSTPVAYLDSSALVKLIAIEAETAALRQELRRWPDRASSLLATVEVTRTARRLGGQAPAVAVGVLAVLVGAQGSVVTSVESALTSSLVESQRLGTAFGILNGVNGAADLVASLVAGLLWTVVGPPAALGLGAVVCFAAAVLLWLRPPGNVHQTAAGTVH